MLYLFTPVVIVSQFFIQNKIVFKFFYEVSLFVFFVVKNIVVTEERQVDEYKFRALE